MKIISPNTSKNAITRLITIVQYKAFFLEVSQKRKKFIKKRNRKREMFTNEHFVHVFRMLIKPISNIIQLINIT